MSILLGSAVLAPMAAPQGFWLSFEKTILKKTVAADANDENLMQLLAKYDPEAFERLQSDVPDNMLQCSNRAQTG
jgi:hypothetical protein